jgi:hypothetical protein
MKKLFVVFCVVLSLVAIPAIAKPPAKCNGKPCKTHHMLKGHKVPEHNKKKNK